jgi:hypothetical protein
MYKRNEFFIFRVYDFHIPVERVSWAIITPHREVSLQSIRLKKILVHGP